ncbi:MAG: shikimate kinase [Aggregatilineales bacterium]
MVDFLSISERNLILTGYIGPNQPLLGRQIGDRLRMRLVNFEEVISERMQLPVAEIRTYYGETRLKSIEAELIQETALRRSTVIRVSGRTLANGDNLERLRETGPVICLTINLDAMLQRLHISMGARFHSPDERALALGDLKREWSVRQLPNVHEIDTTYIDDDTIVERVVALWQELALERG